MNNNSIWSERFSTYYQVIQGFINTAVVILVIYFMFLHFKENAILPLMEK